MQEAPQPAPQLAPEPVRAPLRPALVTAAAAVLMLSAGVAWWTYPVPGDRPLGTTALQERAERYRKAVPLPLTQVRSAEHTAAVETMDLPQPQRKALQQQLENGQAELVWLTLWDDRDQDGDIVSIASDGFRISVELTHAPKQIAVPRPKGGVINLGGVYDGGGGITVAAATPAGNVALPVMGVGQLLGVPVR